MAEGNAAPVAPTQEAGYAVSNTAGTWWTTLSKESTPELRWPLNLTVFDNMRRQDAQVSSVLRAVTTPIMRTPWRIDGAGCDPRVVEHVANDLGLPIVGKGNDVSQLRRRGRFSWTEHLRLALLFLPFGHMFFEQVYWIDPQTGLAHLRKLGPRMQRSISAINVARDGGLESIEQWGPLGVGRGDKIVIPVDRLVAYVLDREGGDWLGTSLLRPAYKHWLLKDRLLRVQTQTVERNGMGIPKYKDQPNGTPDTLEAGEEIAASVRAGDNAGVALPDGADLELMGVSGELPDADKPIRYHDEQIARAVLAHFLNLGTQTGSWALGTTFADFFTLSLQSVADIVRDTATQHVVEDLVDINFGADEPAPRIVFDEIGTRGDSIVNAIAVLVNANVLHADEDLEQFVRTSLGLPAFSGQPTLPLTQEAS